MPTKTELTMKVPEVPGVELRPIPGVIGYAAGDDGSVYSFYRCPGGKRGRVRVSTKPRRLRGAVGGNGYVYVNLRKPGGNRRQTYLAHVIASAFHGMRPEGMDVSHVDGNPLNNRPANLVYESRSKNLKRAVYDHGTMKPPAVRRGETNNKAKLTADRVLSIRREHALLRRLSVAVDGRTPTGTTDALARKFSVTRTTIRDIVNRRTWRHVED